MKFQVPQFIEVEDKIFGPLTLKQFIYVAGGAGAAVALFLVLPIYLSIIPIILVVAFSLALAFYKFNNKPFIGLVESMFRYFIGSRLYIWRKVEKPANTPLTSIDPADYSALIGLPQLDATKLKNLQLTLDTKNPNPPMEGPHTPGA